LIDDRDIPRADERGVILEDERRERKKPPRGGFSGGPSRARTDDLLAASQTLSQLSYGPVEPCKCSPELVLSRPPDSEQLVVSRRDEPKVDLPECDDFVGRQEVALLDVGAVEGERIELARAVPLIPQALGAASARVEASRDHVSDPPRPFALDAEQGRPQIENQVVALIVEWSRHTEPEFDGARGDLELGQRPDSSSAPSHGAAHSRRTVASRVDRSG
jgi:hypothetical protein